MPITERTLKKWRGEALHLRKVLFGWDSVAELTSERRTMTERILRMSQELLDQHLLRKETK